MLQCFLHFPHGKLHGNLCINIFNIVKYKVLLVMRPIEHCSKFCIKYCKKRENKEIRRDEK